MITKAKVICLSCFLFGSVFSDFTIDSHSEVKILNPTVLGFVWDTDADQDGDGAYAGGDYTFLGKRENSPGPRMEKTIVKFAVPSTPSGKRLISARFRIHLRSKAGVDEENVIIKHSKTDNTASIDKSQYEDLSYNATIAAWVENGYVIKGSDAVGAWYEAETQYRLEGDLTDGITSFRLELADLTWGDQNKIFSFERGAGLEPQLILIYTSLVPDSNTANYITIDPSITIRSSRLDHGYNNNIMQFQRGLFNYDQYKLYDTVNLKIFDELKNHLNNSYTSGGEGRAFRFPGGTLSQYLNWKNTIGPVASRPDVYHNATSHYQAKYGFDEYMTNLVKTAYNGIPWIVVNMMSMDENDAADWVEYANCSVGQNPNGGTDWAQERVNNGSSDPYNIQYWELGNEMDCMFSPQEYAEGVTTFMQAMLAVDSSIKFIVHTRSDGVGDARSGGHWHLPLFEDDYIRPKIYGVALHIYYDNPSWNKMFETMRKILALDCDMIDYGVSRKIFITENGLSRDAQGDVTGGTDGAISLADFIILNTQVNDVKKAFIHALGSMNDWWPTLKYNSGNRDPRARDDMANFLKYYSKRWGGYYKTTVSSKQDSGYLYDVNGIGMLNNDGKNSLLLVNRHDDSSVVTVKWTGMSSGQKSITREVYSEDPSSANDMIQAKNTNTTVSVNTSAEFELTLPAKSVTGIIFN
ncbi:MAG: hypothetical protein WC047_03345 [Kiritimatiellales bacterium]